MLNRIALILQTQNLTVSAFADRIGVQRSALSHVLSGRNNPSLDFVTKILRTFPEIRSQWLLFGEGKMYDSLSCVRPAETGGPAVGLETVAGSEAGGLASNLAAGIHGAASGLNAGAGIPVAETAVSAAVEAVSVAENGMGDGLPVEGLNNIENKDVTNEDWPSARPLGLPSAQPSDSLPDYPSDHASDYSSGHPELPPDFVPVQTEGPKLVKVVFFYADGHFEEYGRR